MRKLRFWGLAALLAFTIVPLTGCLCSLDDPNCQPLGMSSVGPGSYGVQAAREQQLERIRLQQQEQQKIQQQQEDEEN